MAYTTINTTGRRPLGTILRDGAAAIGNFLVAYGEHRSRYDRIRKLQALSDEQLAARGLTREGIPAHVFRDVLWM